MSESRVTEALKRLAERQNAAAIAARYAEEIDAGVRITSEIAWVDKQLSDFTDNPTGTTPALFDDLLDARLRLQQQLREMS